ncbi:MAG: hypothetical protein PHV85_01150 [Desulfovibrionaceae bacterium]|nr:hypothetical protein [Desulfovibrionaceae bacterium]
MSRGPQARPGTVNKTDAKARKTKYFNLLHGNGRAGTKEQAEDFYTKSKKDRKRFFFENNFVKKQPACGLGQEFFALM